MDPLTLFYLYVVALTGLLLYPVSRLLWVMSVRRLERKQQRQLNEDEVKGQKQRAYFIALFICFTFAWLFNSHTVGYLLTRGQ